MEPTCSGVEDAEIVAFTKGGRDFRFEQVSRGEDTPLDFFYGFFDLEKAGLSAIMLSASGAVETPLGWCSHLIESALARVTHVSIRPLSARMRLAPLRGSKVIVSYSDGFSVSLGLASSRRSNRPIMIGGFHALSEIVADTPAAVRPVVHAAIGRSLTRLDHVFFFGAADRAYAMQQYGLPLEKTSIFPFGVDTNFWRPLPDESVGDFVASVGQDPNRDFDLLAAAPGNCATVIVTRQPVRVPAGATHVRVTAGDFYGGTAMSDKDLRRFYNQAVAVVVPVKDVYQQSGYSVTLQAMSCARPVIVSGTKGLLSLNLLRDGENCLLVAPGDGAALGAAINYIRNDSDLAARLGHAARETVMTKFNLDRNGDGTVGLARRGLALWHERQARRLAELAGAN